MAEVTGTLILRPVASKGTITTTTPTGTSVEECYKLVNEEAADGATTCIYLKANETVYFHLSNNLIENVSNITGATLVIVGNDGATGANNTSLNTSITKWSEDSVVHTFTGLMTGEDAGEFNQSNTVLTSLDAFSVITNLILSNEVGVCFNNTSTKYSPEISQIYLEVNCTYSIPDDNESSSISFYAKKNGAWSLSTGALYQKNGGIWSRINSTNLNIENLFVIEETVYIPSLEYTINNSTYTVSGIGTCSDTVIAIPKKYKRVLVTGIGNRALSNCDNLTSITIPDSVTSIGGYAFSYCDNLTSITIPDSVTSIGESAFRDCSSLTSITIPNKINLLGSYTFYGCSSLSSITIPESVTSIDSSAFNYCSNLASISVHSGNKVYHSDNNCLIRTDINVLVCGCKNSIIPTDGSVTRIGYQAFKGCSNLSSITIPESVTDIEGNAFYDCSSLTSITIPSSVTNIGSLAFCGCTGLTSINILYGITQISSRAFYNCSGLTSITIPDSVTSIGQSAFERCSGLTSITIPNSVTSIETWAFLDCSSLTNINYTGTQTQWNAINFGEGWDKYTGNYTINYNYVIPTQ